MDIIEEARRATIARLRAVAKQRGITHDVIALRTGIDRTNITHMLSGKNNITLDNYYRLVAAVGIILPKLNDESKG